MTAPRQIGLTPRDYAVALAMNLLWGLNIVAVKFATDAAPPLTVACLRLWLVFIACWSFLRIVPGQMGSLALLGLLSGAGFFGFINLSVQATDNLPALAIAGQVGVPFSLILAIIFLKERIALPRLIGIVLTFGGVAVLLFDPAILDEGIAIAYTVLGSLCWAIASLIQRRLSGVSVLTMFAWIGLVGGVLLTPFAIFVEPQGFASLPDMKVETIGWIAFSAVGASVLGHGGMAWLLKRHPVSLVSPLTLLSPVFSVLISSLVFGTVLTPVMIGGGILCMAGVAIITWRTARRQEEVRP